MPSLPRIRRSRTRDTATAVADAPARPAELSAPGLTWIHLDSPSLERAQELAERFGWHALDVEDVMSKRQRPKVDDYADEGYLFGVLHFPVYDRSIQRLNAGELDFFVGPDYLITLPTVELLPVTRLFRRCEEDEAFRDQLFSKGSGRLLYELLDDLFDYCFPILDKIGYKLDAVEDDIFDGRSEEVVRDISNVKQEIISYRKIIKPERGTLRLLERHIERFLPEELELYFEDIVDATERIWDMLDNYKEVVEALETTNEQIVSHRQNEVLQILTIISFIMLPLFVITGIFGMNVHFPGENTDRRLLGDHRGHDRVRRRHGRVLPPQALAVMPKPLWAPWRLEYVQHADELDRCIFCEPEEELLVHRGERALVVMNKFPYSSGHLLVAPHRHTGDFGALDADEAAEVHALAARGIEALRAEYAPHGFNLGWNIGRVAGAGIEDHVHQHVVPRWNGDTSFMPVLGDVKVLPEHLLRTAERLRARF